VLHLIGKQITDPAKQSRNRNILIERIPVQPAPGRVALVSKRSYLNKPGVPEKAAKLRDQIKELRGKEFLFG
jgi:hypothetical protein